MPWSRHRPQESEDAKGHGTATMFQPDESLYQFVNFEGYLPRDDIDAPGSLLAITLMQENAAGLNHLRMRRQRTSALPLASKHFSFYKCMALLQGPWLVPCGPLTVHQKDSILVGTQHWFPFKWSTRLRSCA